MKFKQIYFSIFLLLAFATTFGQTQTIVERVIRKDPNLSIYTQKDWDKYVIAAAVDKRTHVSYLISCYGQIVDSAHIADEDYELLQQKKATPFKHYNATRDELIRLIEIAKFQLRQNGKINTKWQYANLITEYIPEVKTSPSSLRKIIALDEFEHDLYFQKWLINNPNPKYFMEDSATLYLKYDNTKGGTMIKKTDTTTYYNQDNISLAYKAILFNKQAKIFYYNRENIIIDSIPINPLKIATLLKQKADVFLLYRAWLELEKLNTEEEIKTLQAIDKTASSNSFQYAELNTSIQELLSQSKIQLYSTKVKIEQISIPDPKSIATLLHYELKNVEVNIPLLNSLGVGYTTTVTRGDKKYELTDHRGNVMAVITDKKIQVDANNYGIVDYYVADVISATDYYSGGMQMPGRTYQPDQYRYSINGQEKSDEINTNLTTALYWEYDSRIGRRWNTDPIVKIWQSPYEAFRDNPIVYTDPNGDDDIFDRHGKFLFSTAEGNAIRVINAKTTLTKAQENPTANTKLITEFSYFPANKSNRIMLASIATHYASAVGVTRGVGVADVSKKEESGALAAFQKSLGYNIIVYNGKINTQAADAYNMMNSFVHEKNHEDDPSTRKNSLNHTSAILKQIDDNTFDKTTTEFKRAAGSYAASLLTEAIQIGDTKIGDINSKITQFNNSKLGKYSTLSYDEKTKTVNATAVEEAIIIKSTSRKKQAQKDSTNKQ